MDLTAFGIFAAVGLGVFMGNTLALLLAWKLQKLFG